MQRVSLSVEKYSFFTSKDFNGKFKQWSSTIPWISTKQATTSQPLTSDPSPQIRPWHLMLEIKVLAWDRHKNVAESNQLIGLNYTHVLRYTVINNPKICIHVCNNVFWRFMFSLSMDQPFRVMQRVIFFPWTWKIRNFSENFTKLSRWKLLDWIIYFLQQTRQFILFS